MVLSEAIGELSLNTGKTAVQRRAVFVKSLMCGTGERTTRGLHAVPSDRRGSVGYFQSSAQKSKTAGGGFESVF